MFLSGTPAIAQIVFLESEGQVVVEAETFSSRTPSDTHEWFLVSSGGLFLNPRGSSYIQALPDSGSGSSPLQPPFVDYVVRFDTVGVYRLYVRWAANADQSDTFYASVVELNDGPGGTIADWYRYVRISSVPDFAVAPTWFGSGGFERTDSPYTNGETPAVWTILEPGDYTIRFDMREDGPAIDAFVFQLSSLPAPTGDGPPTSPIVEELIITTTSIPAVKLGDSFSQEFEIVSGEPPFSWSIVDGALPSGVDLSPDGILSGTPPEAGEFTFTVRVEDSNGDFAEKEFTLKVLVTLPPPKIRINKVGTAPVPGREIDYFAIVENVGTVTATDILVTELLDPWFEYISADPVPLSITTIPDPFPPPIENEPIVYDALIKWIIPELAPRDVKVISYKVRLDPTFPIGETVSGTLCLTPAEAEKCRDDYIQCLGLASLECIASVGIGPQWAACFAPKATKCVAFDYMRCMYESSFDCTKSEGTSVGAIDPNEKLVIAERYIQPDQLLVYPIYFENIGTIEARDIFITDMLDTNLDLSTLELLTPDGASLDPATRTLRWELLNRDLLPGETDNVLLSIKPLPGLPSGTEIRNDATIQFEVFDPFTTNEVVNIIDTTLPSCTMDQLPAETSTIDFDISWSGTDEIGEIDTYSIFVSVNYGSFKPFIAKTSDTSTPFTGEPGKTYGFICIATDTAGNTEVQEPIAETDTFVNPPCEGDFNNDNDIDGGDLAAYISNSMGITLEDFALDFGRNICP